MLIIPITIVSIPASTTLDKCLSLSPFSDPYRCDHDHRIVHDHGIMTMIKKIIIVSQVTRINKPCSDTHNPSHDHEEVDHKHDIVSYEPDKLELENKFTQ